MTIEKRPVLSFFALTYGWSWFWWLPVVYALRSFDGAQDIVVPAWAIIFVLLGAYGPSISAIVITARTEGWAGLKTLFSRFTRWRAPIYVHLAIWFTPPIFLLGAMLIDPNNTVLLGAPQWAELWLIPMVILAAIPFGPLGEELGWRGFALPKLQQKHSALASSVIIGVFWCFWHTPLFWAPGGTAISGHEVTFAAVGMYLFGAIGLSIVFTWIFNNSNGSVLLPIAFHASTNAAVVMLLFPNRDGDASYAIQWLSFFPLWVFALALLLHYGRGRLSNNGDAK